MLDLQMEVEDLKGRVKALEAHTMSGMGDMTVAERFGSLHDRVDMVGENILTKMKAGFQHVNRRLDLIDLRLGPIEDRLRLMDDRFESIDLRFEAMDRKFEAIDQRFETMDKRFETMDQRLGRVEGGMADIKAMLLSLGATAPGQN